MTKYLLFTTVLIVGIISFVSGQEKKYGFFDGTDKQTLGLMKNVDKQIEKVRKGDFILEFTDKKGAKVDAHAVIELESHDFAFGTDLFGFHKLPDSNPAKAIALRAIDTLFNTVIICDYWGSNQKELNGPQDWESPEYGFKKANELNKRTRYHALIYNAPNWIHNYKTEEEMWGLIEQRIKGVADKYGDKITEVDVINEFINYQYWNDNPQAQYLKTTNFPDIAKPENGLRVLKIAKKYLPNAKLVVLETSLWNTGNPVFQEIYAYHKSLIEQGAPYDYIGYQAHYYAEGKPFQEGTTKLGPRAFMMDEIDKGIEQMAGLGKPMVITEFNPPSRTNKNKNPDQPRLSDEEVAAWETNFYSLMFSKPYMIGISRWFTIDNLGGRGMDAGVVNEKGQLKPNYFALKKLITQKWHTRWDGNVKGQVAFRGFYGTYVVKIEGKEAFRIHLTQSSTKQTIVVN